MNIPPDLKEADRLLDQYGRWAQDRYQKQHCASIEHKYRPPDNEPNPEPFIADFRAMDIQRVLNLIPLQYRRVLQAHYIPKRMPEDAQRRMLRIPRKMWDETHALGLRMFTNNWKAHGPKKNHTSA